MNKMSKTNVFFKNQYIVLVKINMAWFNGPSGLHIRLLKADTKMKQQLMI